MTDDNFDFSVDASDDVNLDDFSADFFSADKAPVKDSPEVPKAPEPTSQDEPELDLEDAVEEAEAEADEDQTEADADPEDTAPKGKKKSRFQERIDDLTAKLRERERLADESEARLAKALAALEEKNAPKGADTQNTNTTKTDGLVEPTADDLLEDGSPKYPLGDFDPKLLRDLTRYDRAIEREHELKVAENIKAEQVRNEQANVLTETWNTKVTEAKVVYPDYVEKGQGLLETLGDVDQNFALYLTENLMGMDYGPDVFYYLAEHPEEARVIVNSSPEKALNRLGRIEARFEIAAQEKSGKETKLRTTNAPEPAPRNRGSNASAPSIDLANASLDDFELEFFKKKP